MLKGRGYWYILTSNLEQLLDKKKLDVCRAGQKLAPYFERLNIVKYQPIFEILSLSESGENL